MQKTDLPYYVTNFFAIYLPGQKNLSKNTIASSGASVTNEVMVAPADGYLCINDANGGSESFYGKYVCKDIIDLKNKAKDIQLLKSTKIEAHPGKNLFNPNL